MGSMIASLYALKYPEEVSRLISMSSIGCKVPAKNLQTKEAIINTYKTRMGKYGVEWLYDVWNTPNFSPWDIYRVLGYPLTYVMIKGRIKTGGGMKTDVFKSDEEIEAAVNYII